MRGCRVGIIGGGAAGLCAAVLLSRERVPVTVFEALPRVGKKLLATGNGRCNLSNLGVSPAHYRGDRDGIAAVLTTDADPYDTFAACRAAMEQ